MCRRITSSIQHMRIHLISIGGAAMHNIAIALKKIGNEISGSDDEIYEPSKTRLAKVNLLPEKSGWDEERITPNIDLVILGMHAKKNNPELIKALELNIPVVSFPEFIFNHSKDKQRIVVAGSHGKTSTTSIIMHVLKKLNYKFDYLVGAQIEGFDTMARFSDAPIIVIEGDEYLSSALDKRPKMLHYKPHIAVITGIAWDHINVFPTFEEYLYQFYAFMHTIKAGGSLIYYEKDNHLEKLINQLKNKQFSWTPYDSMESNDKGLLVFEEQEYKTNLFGAHNRQNIVAALKVCQLLSIDPIDFFSALASFEGANKRLQLIRDTPERKVYLDFAHAPSKVQATIAAVAERYPESRLTTVLELHTYSSLNPNFLHEYKGTLDLAEKAFVFIDPRSLKKKNSALFTQEQLRDYFQKDDLIFINDSSSLAKALVSLKKNELVLLMSSGKFGNIDLEQYL